MRIWYAFDWTHNHFQAEAAKKAAETAFEECSDAARHEVSPPNQFCFFSFFCFREFLVRLDQTFWWRLALPDGNQWIARRPESGWIDFFFILFFPSLSRAQPNKFAHRLGWHVDLDGSIVVVGYLVVVSTWKRRRRKTKPIDRFRISFFPDYLRHWRRITFLCIGTAIVRPSVRPSSYTFQMNST